MSPAALQIVDLSLVEAWSVLDILSRREDAKPLIGALNAAAVVVYGMGANRRGDRKQGMKQMLLEVW